MRKNLKIWHPELSIILTEDIGDNCIIHAPVWIGKGVKIGNGCKIEAFAFLPDGITLEDNVFIGPSVTFCNDKYPPSGGKYWMQTLVKKGTAIGGNSTILPGVTIGEDVLIGAGSVVTGDIPNRELWFGNPAHFYKKYNKNQKDD